MKMVTEAEYLLCNTNLSFIQYTQSHCALLWRKYYNQNSEDALTYFSCSSDLFLGKFIQGKRWFAGKGHCWGTLQHVHLSGVILTLKGAGIKRNHDVLIAKKYPSQKAGILIICLMLTCTHFTSTNNSRLYTFTYFISKLWGCRGKLRLRILSTV